MFFMVLITHNCEVIDNFYDTEIDFLSSAFF